MSILCAQYNVEVMFDNYVEGSTINHEALELVFRKALQDVIDKMQFMPDGTRHPLIMPMVVTSVTFETDYSPGGQDELIG